MQSLPGEGFSHAALSMLRSRRHSFFKFSAILSARLERSCACPFNYRKSWQDAWSRTFLIAHILSTKLGSRDGYLRSNLLAPNGSPVWLDTVFRSHNW